MNLNEQEAFQCLAEACIYYINNKAWDQIQLKVKVFTEMITPYFSYLYNDVLFDKVENLSLQQNMLILEASLALKDNILNLTGDRIWGLTFTLYPTGKFKIEYDYEKPEGYEESEEIITGDEINESLSNIKK
ncbi:hypothetical protein [Acinetobacter soli]|jgi:hypothetical protein|uniref:hypothetical protein n=1 Tax=Acinetobacter soli TaxID=487316 RepID=UPI00124F8922|nr:hypothetical protein [Acinetobacter soli]